MAYEPLTADQMVTVKGIAPFELADIFAEWARRDCTPDPEPSRCGGLGPPYRMKHVPVGAGIVTREETPEEFGLRIATGIIHLLKEA